MENVENAEEEIKFEEIEKGEKNKVLTKLFSLDINNMKSLMLIVNQLLLIEKGKGN